NKATSEIGKGDFEHTIDISQHDEFGNLADSFNRMTSKLQKTTTSIELLENEVVDRKQAEKALKNNQKFLNEIINQSPFATWISDEKGTIIKCNTALEKLLNITDEQLIGKYNVFEDEIAIEQGLIPKIRTVFEDGKTANFSVEWDANEIGYKDAKKVHIEGTMFPIHDNKGNLTNVVNHWIDITKRKQAEKAKTQLEVQLQQTQKMESIGTLAGGIAHDFNNILFPIIGHSEMLMEDIPEESPFSNDIKQIYTGAMRASELVKQILTFSRQESGELKLMKMQPIIKEALKLIRSTIPTSIEIKQNLLSDCGAIKADPTQIHQIVMNLATNAYHAMEKTCGTLNIRLKEVEREEPDLFDSDIKPGKYACLSISDTGKGMDKKLIEKIFDPFFTTKKIGKGTGMGLSVVHGIIKNMHGTIKVYSELNKGTEFHVYLPIAETVKKQKVAYNTAVIQGGTEHILLVDDEQSIIEMEKIMLLRLGYKVTTRTSSIEALEAFRPTPDKFDMVITDMAMPNLSGDELSVELNKIRSGIPVLLCTGFSETMSEEKATAMGINGFLLKPIVKKELAHKIREVLDKK
ncbi:ATP-binding protein, partial [Desulfobacterales bacterium HSG17]|nr:ATP-binding protein [Desulfobacterales bacterium HSG17]